MGLRLFFSEQFDFWKKLDQNIWFSKRKNDNHLKTVTDSVSKLTFTFTDSSEDKSSSAIFEKAFAEKCEVDIFSCD